MGEIEIDVQTALDDLGQHIAKLAIDNAILRGTINALQQKVNDLESRLAAMDLI